MYSFKVTDRVRIIRQVDTTYLNVGEIGTIVHIDDKGWPPIGVVWEHPFNTAHDCQGRCKPGYGWYVFPEDIELVIEGEIKVEKEEEKEVTRRIKMRK
jgi:Xrn1 SH3-like domain